MNIKTVFKFSVLPFPVMSEDNLLSGRWMGLTPRDNVSSNTFDWDMKQHGPEGFTQVVQFVTYRLGETRMGLFIVKANPQSDSIIPIRRKTTYDLGGNQEIILPPSSYDYVITGDKVSLDQIPLSWNFSFKLEGGYRSFRSELESGLINAGFAIERNDAFQPVVVLRFSGNRYIVGPTTSVPSDCDLRYIPLAANNSAWPDACLVPGTGQIDPIIPRKPNGRIVSLIDITSVESGGIVQTQSEIRFLDGVDVSLREVSRVTRPYRIAE